MKKISAINTAIFIFGLLVCAVVYAAPRENRAYIEGNLGVSRVEGINLFQGNSYENGVGANANLGYLAGKYFAGELGYGNWGHGINVIDIAAKFILPICTNQFDMSVFGKIGPAFYFDDDSSGPVPYLGYGLSYAISSNTDITFQAQGVPMVIVSAALYSVGLTYHFE